MEEKSIFTYWRYGYIAASITFFIPIIYIVINLPFVIKSLKSVYDKSGVNILLILYASILLFFIIIPIIIFLLYGFGKIKDNIFTKLSLFPLFIPFTLLLFGLLLERYNNLEGLEGSGLEFVVLLILGIPICCILLYIGFLISALKKN